MSLKNRIVTFFLCFVSCLPAFSQQVNHTLANDYDLDGNKIIPDKFFEIGVPFLFLFLLANVLVSFLKTKTENRLKEKAIDKGISEATLLALFTEDQRLNKMVYFKWFLVLTALALSLFTIHSFATLLRANSGYLALAIISLFQGIALLIYYRILRSR
jgi:hypothetical protein